MTDIQNPKLLYLKGALMLLNGSLAAILVIAQAPSLTMVLLLAICDVLPKTALQNSFFGD